MIAPETVVLSVVRATLLFWLVVALAALGGVQLVLRAAAYLAARWEGRRA